MRTHLLASVGLCIPLHSFIFFFYFCFSNLTLLDLEKFSRNMIRYRKF